jgi:hypothetical protein
VAGPGTIVTYGSTKDMTPTQPLYPRMFKAVTVKTVLVYLLSWAPRRQSLSHLVRLLEEAPPVILEM